MKSEQEFLTSMWSEINTRELEEKQKLLAHEANRKLFVKELFTYGLLLTIFAAVILIAYATKGHREILYAVAVLLLCAVFFAERQFYSKSQGVFVDENRNYD